MSERFDDALRARGAGLSLEDTVSLLSAAIAEANAEGKDPCLDPAVMLFGLSISFMLHADVASQADFHRLVELCHTHQAVTRIQPYTTH